MTFNIGDPLYLHEQFEALPVGTQVMGGSGDDGPYTKYEDHWTNEDGSTYGSHTNFALGGYNKVSYLPPGYEVPLTLTQFKQRFRTVAIGGAQRAGVAIDPVLRVLDKLGVTEFAPVRGMWLDISDNYLLRDLPENTLLVAGDPDDYDKCGFFTINHGHIRHALGPIEEAPVMLQVYDLPPGCPSESADWPQQAGTDEDREHVRLFKSDAWKVGVKAKAENSWCPEYEAVMLRVGISERSLIHDPMSVGSTVGTDECLGLPLGSILTYGSATTDTYYVFRRTDINPSVAGTENVMGTSRSPRYASDGMVIRWLGGSGEPMAVPVEDTAHLDLAPVGTRVDYYVSGRPAGTEYEKQDDGRWWNGSSNFDRHGFSGTWMYTRFGDSDA